jgi:sugar/nucleoside kinase (ribokinase family)
MDRTFLQPGGSVVDRPGGNGLVVACVAAKLGWPTILAAQLVDDDDGRALRDRLVACGVTIQAHVPASAPRTKRAEIEVDTRGAWRTLRSDPPRYPYLGSAGASAALDGCAALVLTGLCSLWRSCPEAVRAWVDAARTRRVPITLGLNRLGPGERDAVDALVRNEDRLFCNREELAAWCDSSTNTVELEATLAHAPGGDVVVSLGSEGLWVRPRGRAVVHLPTPRVPVRSSLGAGDMLCAVTTVLRAAGVPLIPAVTLAQRCAARSVRDMAWSSWLDSDHELIEEVRRAWT